MRGVRRFTYIGGLTDAARCATIRLITVAKLGETGTAIREGLSEEKIEPGGSAHLMSNLNE
jgi:hypothetical protein